MSCGPAPAGAETASTTGAFARPPARSSVSATVRALLSFGMTVASTADHVVATEGAASATIAVAVTAAIAPGRRITAYARRRQRVAAAVPGRAPRRASRVPHRANSAGEITS